MQYKKATTKNIQQANKYNFISPSQHGSMAFITTIINSYK